MAPLGLVLFIGSMGMMEGRTRSQIKQKYQDLYGDAIVANWKVWPVAQLVNFRFMPLPYRVPFSQACGVFWTLYLSMLNSRYAPFVNGLSDRQPLTESCREDKKQDDRVAENIEIICRREHPEAYSTHEGSGHRV
jgi:protein Mpv17